VKTRPPRLQADAAVVCDTEMFAPELPTICVDCAAWCITSCLCRRRPRSAFRRIRGAAPNPILAISEILCALKDRNGHIQIPGSTIACCASAKERRHGAAAFDLKEYTEKEMGAKELVGEPEVPLFDRVWRGLRWKCTASARLHRRGRQDRDPAAR